MPKLRLDMLNEDGDRIRYVPKLEIMANDSRATVKSFLLMIRRKGRGKRRMMPEIICCLNRQPDSTEGANLLP